MRKRARASLARIASRLLRDSAGIAAVEFALILPLMLMLYLGLVEMSRGLRASQKVDLVAHMLADLTAQQLTGGQGSGQAGLTNTDFTETFAAANLIMSPLSTTNLKMTISEVAISSPEAGKWQAKTTWTVIKNGATARPCQVLEPSNAAPVSYTTMPTSYTQVTNSMNPVTGSVIVADVIYTYSPGVNFEMNKWGAAPTFTMKRSSYAAVRNNFTPNHIQFRTDQGAITGGANCQTPTL